MRDLRFEDWISEEEIVGLLRDLVAIPSYSGLENQEKEVAEYIRETFQKEGIEAKLIEVTEGRYNVFAAIRGSDRGKTLLLTGHTDTVPPYNMADPFTLKSQGNRLYGRGTVDMKGPLACMIFAMIAIQRSKLRPAGDILFAGVIDEEERSLGTINVIEEGLTADAAIVGEPTNLDLAIAHRGLEWFEIHFHGKTVHGGKQKEGINAIQKAGKFIQRCEETLIPEIEKENHPLIGTSSMNYGTIQGGTQPSTVAGECVLTLDRRWVPGVSYRKVVKDIEDLIKDLAKEDPEFRCTLKVKDGSRMKEGFVHEAMELDSEHPIIPLLQSSTKELLADRGEISFFPAWTDGGLLSHYANIPTIVFGPGELESAHSPEEYIDQRELLPAALIYAKTAMEFCRQEPEQ